MLVCLYPFTVTHDVQVRLLETHVHRRYFSDLSPLNSNFQGLGEEN